MHGGELMPSKFCTICTAPQRSKAFSDIDFINNIKKAKEEIVNYIKSSKCGNIVFAEGDDILFRGKFSIEELLYIKKMYRERQKS